jgi:hypothetical protein
MTAFVVYRYTNIFRKWALSFLFSGLLFPILESISPPHFPVGDHLLPNSRRVLRKWGRMSHGKSPYKYLLIYASLWMTSGASGVTIDFETLPNGSAPVAFSEIGNAYESLGVIFGTLESDDPKGPSYRDQGLLDGGPTQLLAWDGSRVSPRSAGFHLFASFVEPMFAVSFDTWAGQRSDIHVIARALDASGDLLGDFDSGPVFGHDKGRAEFGEIGPISFLFVTTNQPFISGIGIDNLEFTTVPEPGTGLLLAMGVAGLSLGRRSPRNPAAIQPSPRECPL